MYEEPLKIFIVDDDPGARMIVANEIQSDDYELHEFSDGESCLSEIHLMPDLVLMDVEMPYLNGYDTCRRLKENSSTEHIDVIFISSHDTTEERLAGYDAGASDYVIKPIQPVELKQKVLLSLKNSETKRGMAVESQSAMQTAMMAISNAGEQGIVLDFMRRSFHTSNVDELAALIVESFFNFGLDTTVQIRTPADVVNKSSKEPIRPLEVELLSRLKDAGRIKEIGMRLIANFGDISLLISKMPDDDDKRGRLRDHLALLLEGAEARLHSIVMEQGLADVVVDAKKSLLLIESMQKTNKGASMKIMDDVMADLEESFMSCGLSEEQEGMLMAIVKTGVDQTLENFEKGLTIDEELTKIVGNLENVFTH